MIVVFVSASNNYGVPSYCHQLLASHTHSFHHLIASNGASNGVRGWDKANLLCCSLTQEEERCITHWFMEVSAMDSVHKKGDIYISTKDTHKELTFIVF